MVILADGDRELPRPAASTPLRSIRAEYERHGAREFYQEFGAAYRNPHETIIAKSIASAVSRWKPDLQNVLDLAAGSGEATLALRALGAKQITGIDPYTADAYLARTGQPAERFTFADIGGGALAGRSYGLIVCSFALHLCEPSRLPGVCYQLAQVADELLIVTPHKRPILRREWGWNLEGEDVLERVRSRMYRKIAT